MKASIAHAPTEVVLRIKAQGALRTDEQRQRVLRAAIEAVYRSFCSNSVAELEDAVVGLMGVPIERDDD